MLNNLKELLKKLAECPGPSGQEQQVRSLIVEELKPFCKELREDPLGNLIAKVGADDGYKVSILAHMDEVGLIVSGIYENGLISFELLGSLDVRCLLSREVDIINLDGKLIRGVIGNGSRHLQTAERLTEQLSHKQLWIDIGSKSLNDVLEQRISIGCGIVFSTKFHIYPNGTILGKALDNRMGCTVLIEALKSLSSNLKTATVLGMFTCQEEIGAKGARVVAFDSRPQMAITLDTVPLKNPDKLGFQDIDLSRGPVIRLFDWHPSTTYGMYTHPLIKDRLVEVAQKGKIAYQVDVITNTFLDSSQVHLTAGGIPGGSICFPRRYAHCPVEVGHLNDIMGGLNLLIKFVRSLEKDPIKFGKMY